nr:RNA-directed DNA polymerase, eukaryota [Tanacetum cinerariifolium]
MANTTPIVTTVTKTANKEKTPKEEDAALKANILDFCEEHYEDILPVIMDKIRRDKRKEVHARQVGITRQCHMDKHERWASGLKINLSKSKIMGIGVDAEKVSKAAIKLGCLILKNPFLYLGIYVGGNMNRIQSWDDIVNRVKSRLSKWKMKMLSIGGRITRWPRGVAEISQMEKLKNMIDPVSLKQGKDSWVWSMDTSGMYSVASVRNLIDSCLLPSSGLKTRWIRYVPIKVNIFAWKVMTNSLPTKFNISRRGIDIESISCVNCDFGVENTNH